MGGFFGRGTKPEPPVSQPLEPFVTITLDEPEPPVSQPALDEPEPPVNQPTLNEPEPPSGESPEDLEIPYDRRRDESSCSILGEPTTPLKVFSEHPSYHGKMTGEEAGKILQEHGGTCYLTRYSKSNDSYMLSVIQRKVGRDKDDFLLEHYKLEIDEWGHAEIVGTKKTFEDISKLLLFYKKPPIDHDILGIGKTVRAAQKEIIYVEDSSDDDDCGKQPEKSYWKAAPQPTLATLKDLQWTDEEGETQHFHLIAEVSDTWRDVAILLGMGNAAVVNIEQKSNDNVRRFEEVMAYWLENCTSHDTYPATWTGLQELLRVVQRGTAAEQLQKAL